jgi:hypothetical protein
VCTFTSYGGRTGERPTATICKAIPCQGLGTVVDAFRAHNHNGAMGAQGRHGNIAVLKAAKLVPVCLVCWNEQVVLCYSDCKLHSILDRTVVFAVRKSSQITACTYIHMQQYNRGIHFGRLSFFREYWYLDFIRRRRPGPTRCRIGSEINFFCLRATRFRSCCYCKASIV